MTTLPVKKEDLSKSNKRSGTGVANKIEINLLF
jgi:hypothetical protein